MEQPRDVKEMHTKQLVNELDDLRATIHKFEREYGFDPQPEASRFLEVQTELLGREHIPNKQEARAIRQEKARNK